MSWWPFVARAHHVEVTAQLRAALAVADTRADRAEKATAELTERYDALHVAHSARYDALAERYDALVRASLRPQGVVVENADGTLPPVAREPDELKALIAEQCGTDLRKRAMMLRQLAADRAAGKQSERIRDDILAGVSPIGVPA